MSIKKRFIRYKVYLDRSRQYSIYAAFCMQGATMVGAWSSESTRGWLKHHALLSIFIGVAIIIIPHLIVGRLDYIWGLNAEENRRHSETNPVTLEILERLKRIEEKLDNE